MMLSRQSLPIVRCPNQTFDKKANVWYNIGIGEILYHFRGVIQLVKKFCLISKKSKVQVLLPRPIFNQGDNNESNTNGQ